MQDIIDFLQDPSDYQLGIRLLEANTKNRQLVNFLARKENANNREKLVYELGKLVDVPVVPKVSENDKSTTDNTEDTEPTGECSEKCSKEECALKCQQGKFTEPATHSSPLTPHQTDLYEKFEKEAEKLYRERANLSNTLADAQSEEERKEIADKIEAINALYDAKKAEIEGLGKATEATSEKSTVEIDPQIAVLKLERDKLRQIVSKKKKNITDNPSSKNVLTWQTDQAKAEEEIKEIDKKIALLDLKDGSKEPSE